MRRSITAAAIVCVAILIVGLSNRPTHGAGEFYSYRAGSSSAAGNQPAQAVPATENGSGFVTWGYLRMHHPQTVLDMIKQVQAGETDAKSLAGLASPRRLAQLLAQRYDNVSLRQIPIQTQTIQGQSVRPRGLGGIGAQARQGPQFPGTRTERGADSRAVRTLGSVFVTSSWRSQDEKICHDSRQHRRAGHSAYCVSRATIAYCGRVLFLLGTDRPQYEFCSLMLRLG